MRAPASSSHGPSRLSHLDHRRRPRHPVPGVGMGGMWRGLRRDLSLMLSPAHAHATHAWMEKDLLLSPCHIIPVGFFPASSLGDRVLFFTPCAYSPVVQIAGGSPGSRDTSLWFRMRSQSAGRAYWPHSTCLSRPLLLISQQLCAGGRGAGGGPGGSPPHRPGSPTGTAHPAALPTTGPPR